MLSPNSANAIDTRAELAQRAGVAPDTISKVERIKEAAPAVLIEAVRKGDVSIHQAAQALGESAAIDTRTAIGHPEESWQYPGNSPGKKKACYRFDSKVFNTDAV